MSIHHRSNVLRQAATLIFLIATLGLAPAATQASNGPDTPPATTGRAGAARERAAVPSAEPRHNGTVPLLEPINDPIEPFNRAMFTVNDQLIALLINPLASGWRTIAPTPVRTSVRKFGTNLAYPVRLVNTLLQGKGKGALSETARFLINSTVGLLGFFDPATRIGLAAYEEDFGQTLGRWGSDPGFYLVIPFFGPGSGRDYFGWIFDTALNPATYAAGSSTFFAFNKFSFSLPAYLQLSQSEHDPYVLVRDMEALRRKKDVLDYVADANDIDPDPTLNWLYIKPNDPDFYKKAFIRQALVTATGRKLPYSAWLQPFPAPLVFVLGGTGGHRLTNSTLAMAEALYRERFSVVTISNSMNWEFMENAATVSVPGYPPQDAKDIYNALDCVHRDLKRRFPGRFNRATALLGYSMGGLYAMYISSFADKIPADSLHFDRYLALDTPVDLLYALNNLDRYYNAPLEWPPEERRRRMEGTIMKVLALNSGETDPPAAKLPFSGIESRFLIGVGFKLALRDVIYCSQKRENLHVLKAGFSPFARQDVYDDIMRYSFMDYVNLFVIPYFMNKSSLHLSREELLRRSSLRSIEDSLRGDTRLRAFNNENDFFLRREDLEWYKRVLGERLTTLSEGGHMGNLFQPEVMKKIIGSIQDIKAIRHDW